MPLSPSKELKLSEYFEMYGISKYMQPRVRTIAEMSNDGASIKKNTFRGRRKYWGFN